MSDRHSFAGSRPGPSPTHPAAWIPVVVAAFAIALSVTYPLNDPDLFQHLTAGKAIWRLHRIPLQHLWTWPSYGKPEVLPSWLFAALIWPLWANAGVWGLFAWRWLTTLGAFGLLWATARRLGGRGVAPLLALVVCALVYRQRTQMRPETLVAVLLALELWVLESGRAGKDRSGWLVGVALVWANVHISYYLGFVLVGAFDDGTIDGGRFERVPVLAQELQPL